MTCDQCYECRSWMVRAYWDVLRKRARIFCDRCAVELGFRWIEERG
jgi:hypothetical protein